MGLTQKFASSVCGSLLLGGGGIKVEALFCGKLGIGG
jgi:hypothetical protein